MPCRRCGVAWRRQGDAELTAKKEVLSFKLAPQSSDMSRLTHRKLLQPNAADEKSGYCFEAPFGYIEDECWSEAAMGELVAWGLGIALGYMAKDLLSSRSRILPFALSIIV